MRVVVREAFKAYINHQPENFHVGQKIKGDTAVLLLRTRAAVDPEDEEAAELADSLEDKSEDDDQEQETEQPLTPSTPAVVPVDIPGGGANPSRRPAQVRSSTPTRRWPTSSPGSGTTPSGQPSRSPRNRPRRALAPPW